MDRGLVRRYLAAVAGLGRTARGEVTPSALAAVCVELLPVDGAGISLVSAELRVPLGWSGNEVASAEGIQTTLGEGPCLSAAGTGTAMVVDEQTIAARWPVYHHQLRRHTRFASVAACPLGGSGEPGVAALNLYAFRSDLSGVLSLTDVTAIAGLMTATLLGLAANESGSDDWIDDGPAHDRLLVWRAVGVLMAASHRDKPGRDDDQAGRRAGLGVRRFEPALDDQDALALLRAFAFSHDLHLDQVARQLNDQTLAPAAVLAN